MNTGLSLNISHIPLHNWSVGGQIGGVFTHWVVGKFVESDGAKGALGPAFFAMAARLTCEVRASQFTNGQYTRIPHAQNMQISICQPQKLPSLSPLCKNATFQSS